jgi:hypothetical protein
VRRLFFIFNKIDLLAPEELHTTREFIGATLQREGLSPTAVRLYPVRARKARSEQEARMDDGIERVRDEIIDFMVREKYFALSEALDAKFTGAIEEITGALEEEKRSIEEPIARLRQERDALCGRIESLRAWIESQDKADEADRAELDGHIESLMADKTRLLVTGLEERLEHLLTGPLPGPAQAPLVESTFSTMLEEGLARARLEGITDVNALLRGFERERAGRLQEVYESATALLPASCDIDDSPRAEIDPAHPAPRLPAFALAPDELKKGGLFAGAEARRRRLHERLGPKLREAAEEGCADLREQLRALALERLDELEGHTTRCVGPLHESLERLHDEKAVALEEAQRAAAPRLAKTGGLLKNFGAVCGAGGSDHA